MKSRHEPVPQPKGQSASRPERLVTHPCPVCFFPGRGRHVPAPSGGASGLSFCGVLPPSPLFFRFSVLVSQELSRSRECTVATPAIRWVSRVVVPRLLVAVRFLETAVAPRAQGADPSTAHLFSYPFSTYAVGTFLAVFADVLGLWFLASSCRNFGNTRS